MKTYVEIVLLCGEYWLGQYGLLLPFRART